MLNIFRKVLGTIIGIVVFLGVMGFITHHSAAGFPAAIMYGFFLVAPCMMVGHLISRTK